MNLNRQAHYPQYEKRGNLTFYVKVETDDNCIHHKTFSLSINKAFMQPADFVEVHLKHRNVILYASKERLENSALENCYHGEEKYYLHLENWSVVGENKNWYNEIMRVKA